MVAGFCYLFQVTNDIRALRLANEDMLPSEEIIMECHCCHYRTGRPFKSWESVGGVLVLSSHRLAFLAHRGQLWHYQLFLPVEQISKAETCPLFGSIPGCMRVTSVGGKHELFNFGMTHEVEAERCAAVILPAHYRANPDWGSDR